MSRRRRQIPGPGGALVWAEELDFRSEGEHFNTYLLEDGTIIRVKLVATAIFKLDNVKDDEGNPVYVVRSNNVLAVSVPQQG